MSGQVYFVQGTHGGPIKIGWTSGPVENRIRGMQTGSSDELRVIASVEGSRLDEKKLHDELWMYRLRGEWFRDCAAVREVVGRFVKEGERPKVRVKMLRCGCIPGFHFCPEAKAAWMKVGLAMAREDRVAYSVALRTFVDHKPIPARLLELEEIAA